MKLDWKTCFKIGISVFILYLAIYYWPGVNTGIRLVLGALAPIIVGAIVSYPLNILMTSFERIYFPKTEKKALIKSRRPVCLVLAILTLLAIIALVVGLIVPQFVSCIKLLIDILPNAIRNFITSLEKFEVLPNDIIASLSSIDWQSKIGEWAKVVTSGIGSVMDVLVNAVYSVFSGIVTAFLGIIFAVYILLSKERLSRQFKSTMAHYVKKNWYEKIYYVLSTFNDCFKRYIIGQCTEAVILGILCTLGMLILRLPYATMIGALVAFMALIPVAGAYIGAGVGAFMILMVSPLKALIFLVFIVVLQQFEGNVIYPRVVGSSVGLPGIWILAAVTIGGGVLGVGGMLLGVPIASAIYRIVRNDVNGVSPIIASKAKPEAEGK